MQRRLFLIFFLLALLPAAALILVNWQVSQRHLAYMDSPGLRRSMESALTLAREILEEEKSKAAAEAARLAASGEDGSRPEASPGASYRFRGMEHPESWGPAVGSVDPLSAFGDRLEAARAEPLRVDLDGAPYLLASAPASRDGEAGLLYLLSPLDPARMALLDAIARGGSRSRQLRLFYGDLLRGDTLLTLLALGLVLLVLALWLSRRFARRIARPIAALVAGTERVAGGDLAFRVDARAPDEVGDLIAAFNRMTGELERGRDELLRAERLAAWQGVARRLAHEIKNPLTPITLAMHRIQSRSEDGTVQDCVSAVLDETQNLQRLADEFSQFARLPAPVLSALDLHELVAGVVDLYLRQGRIEIVWEGWQASEWIEGDAGLLRQVFANLVKNATEAMGEKGRLVLGLARPDDEDLCVRIRDSGPGLPEDPERLFQPSISTKSSGSGLGLAIARKIVEDHGGRLEAANHPAGGAEFRVTLPAAAPPVAAQDSPERA